MNIWLVSWYLPYCNHTATYLLDGLNLSKRSINLNKDDVEYFFVQGISWYFIVMHGYLGNEGFSDFRSYFSARMPDSSNMCLDMGVGRT